MKLQYLGDKRDAFKWDLLHWICTTSPFSKLVFVPLLTPDVEGSAEGLISHRRFKCQNYIRPFLESLREEPRSLSKVSQLGIADPEKPFEVYVFAPDKFISSGSDRCQYWADFDASKFENSVIFFDPDNGFETKTQSGSKWIEHEELRNFFLRLPATSVALVYQHRPRRRWVDVFVDLIANLSYINVAVAAHESDLAFIAMAGNANAGANITKALTEYASRHPSVEVTPLYSGGRPDDESCRRAAILGSLMLDRMEAADSSQRRS